MVPSLHPQEAARLAALHRYQILDTLSEEDYDDLVRIAASVCETSIALISLVDESRQWFKSVIGLDGLRETSRDISVCAHAILEQSDVSVYPDLTADPRFSNNPLVSDSDPQLRFYAGAKILDPEEKLPLGMLCVADTRVRRDLTEQQKQVLTALSRQIGNLMELRRRRMELIEANRMLVELSSTDSLTGLPNRRSLDLHLAAAIDAAGGSACLPVSVLMMDLDHFKSLNDTHGHAAGDVALQSVAATLRSGLRTDAGDFVARAGGEEFVAILPDTPLKSAAVAAERLREMVESIECPFGQLTISIGAAQLTPFQCVSPEASTRVLAAADRALYRAKAEGRNRVVAG